MKRPSRTTLYLILICLFLLAVNVSLGFVLIRQSSAAMRSLIESRMLDVSNTAAAMLDGDTLEKLQAEDVDTPEYQDAYRTLSCFEDNIELEYIYCVRDMGDGSFVFMIDPDPDEPGQFGEHIPYTDALSQASLGTAAVDKVPYADSWGRFYSAYSPVFNSENRVAGIVAVDFSAEWYENQVSDQVRSTLWVSGISLFFAGVMIFLIAARYRNRIREMLNQMNAVSEGIETLVREVSPGAEACPRRTEREVPSNDEISELGNRIQALERQLSEEISFVRSQAYVDGLTGLGNRTAYEDRVKQLDDDIRDGRAAFAVAVFDLNGLKEINDKYGHAQGDRAISRVAAALRQTFGDARLYRIGGDEFIVLLEAPSSEIASQMRDVDRILSENDPVSTAKGYAAFTEDADTDYREVFNRADTAMYNDKREYYTKHGDRRRQA